MVFSHRIKKIRKRLNLSQKAFAEKVGVDQGRVSQWETEKSLPHSKALMKMANLGVNINWLLTGDGEMMVGAPSSPRSKGFFSEKQIEQIEKLIDEKIDERFNRILKKNLR